MENKLNVYAKIQKARVMLDSCNLKKTGENKFSRYFYYTLDDIMPAINKILLEVGLFARTDINSEMGTLTAIDIDNPDDRVVFTMESAKFEMKGANAIQEIASLQTYVRRYLYITFLEISEADTIDSTAQSEAKATESKDKPKNNKSKTTGEETLVSVKAEVLTLCKDLSENGKRDIVQETVKKYHITPNPTGMKDLGKLQQLREDLKKL